MRQVEILNSLSRRDLQFMWVKGGVEQASPLICLQN